MSDNSREASASVLGYRLREPATRTVAVENALAEVARKEKAVGPIASQCSEETQMRNADVLRLIHNDKLERRFLVLNEDSGQSNFRRSAHRQALSW